MLRELFIELLIFAVLFELVLVLVLVLVLELVEFELFGNVMAGNAYCIGIGAEDSEILFTH